MGSHTSVVKPYTAAPKKRLGQHFLRDTGMIDRIVRWMEPDPGDLFLEIGAGEGALSLRLAPLVATLISIELDRDRIPGLQAAVGPYESTTVVQADILHMDVADLVLSRRKPEQRVRIAGNLPYNIGTAIIEKFLDSGLEFRDMMFMVQMEVAQRITAEPGTRQYGYLSVHCQHHCDVQAGFRVPPSCFVPRPRVYSAMVSLRPKPIPQDPEYEADLEELGKAAFSHRRKTLANSLGKHSKFGGIAYRLLQTAGIDGGRRAETLSVAEFETLTRTYRNMVQSRMSNVEN